MSLHTLEERYIDLNNAKIHYLEIGNGDPVLLFHGARFNSYIWKDTKTIYTIANKGFKALSIDFPGFGKSTRGNYNSLSQFIKDFIDYFNFDKVILLGASMGGQAVLEYTVNNYNKVKGLILVGAVGVDLYENKLKNLENIKTLLIWGKNDNISPRSNAELLLKYIKNAKFVNIGINHACYLDDPDNFNKEIEKFLSEF